MKLKGLLEISSAKINNSILNHNLKNDFDETTDEVKKSNFIKLKNKKTPNSKTVKGIADRPLFKEEKEYIIIDKQSGKQIGKNYKSKKTAIDRAKKLDIGWGGNRYTTKLLTEMASQYVQKNDWLATAKDAGATSFIDDENKNRLNAYFDDEIIGYWDFNTNNGIIFNNVENTIMDESNINNKIVLKENMMKLSFKQFLLEKFGVTGHEHDRTSNIKADMVDIIRKHINPTEVLFSNLRQGKEKEFFFYYFNKLLQKFDMDAIKHKELFKNGFAIYFHTSNVKPGHFLKISAVLPDDQTAHDIYEELVGKFKTKV